MSQPDDDSREALKRLDERLTAFKAGAAPPGPGDRSAESSMADGYRLLGEVIGGILGGLGLGWVFDHFAHTTPFGLVIGLLLGTAASAYAAMKSADQMGRRSAKPPPEQGNKTLMAEIQPMEQFLIHRVEWLPSFGVAVPGLGYVDLSITNSVLTMIGAAAAISIFFLASAQGRIVPGRLQAFGEIIYDLVDKGLTGPMIGDRGRPFLPYVFALFSLIAVMNIWGIVPGSFTVTSQLAITITLAIVTFAMVVVVGFVRNGLGFFKLFVPGGVHWVMLLLVVPIEVVSFLVRPITLSMRLFGNMIGGHVVLYMFGSFVVGMAAFAMQGGLAYLGFIGSGLSLFMVVALSALELIVAFLQAFVFAALTCTYLSDVVNLDHGH